MEVSVETMEVGELKCKPPKGDPEPYVSVHYYSSHDMHMPSVARFVWLLSDGVGWLCCYVSPLLPQVYWEKDGVRIDDQTNPNYIVSHDGSLFINIATHTDEANYSCIADNDFFRRSSQPASLHVYSKSQLQCPVTVYSCK